MVVIGQGEFKPITGNDTDKGRNSNRRVMVVVQNDTPVAPASAAATPEVSTP
jgi:hypothetical protein